MTNKIKLYDTHAHPNLEPLLNCLDEILSESNENELFFNVVGVDLESSEKAIQIAQRASARVKACIAIHPNDVQKFDLNQAKSELNNMCENYINVISAIGECGLDFYYTKEFTDIQYQFLDMHVELANKFNLPLMLHVRNAHNEMVEYIKKKKIDNPIIFHCFSENREIAKKILKIADSQTIYFSIPGIVTFKNATALQDAISEIPLEKMVVETDSPWLAPMPYRGKMNRPIYVKHTVQKIAEIKNTDYKKVAEITFNNAMNLFRKTNR